MLLSGNSIVTGPQHFLGFLLSIGLWAGGRQQDCVGAVQGGLYAASAPASALLSQAGSHLQWPRVATVKCVFCATSKISSACLQVADSKTVWGLCKEGCTLQVHQPQRYCDKLAAICSGLEKRLGCLVGINAYITPAGTQVIQLSPFC